MPSGLEASSDRSNVRAASTSSGSSTNFAHAAKQAAVVKKKKQDGQSDWQTESEGSFEKNLAINEEPSERMPIAIRTIAYADIFGHVWKRVFPNLKVLVGINLMLLVIALIIGYLCGNYPGCRNLRLDIFRLPDKNGIKALFHYWRNFSSLWRHFTSREENRMELRQPPNRYVLLFPGRTGSTYVTDHMASHPEIVAYYEVLCQYRESWQQQRMYFDQTLLKKRVPNIKAIGFKTKLSLVMDLDAFESYLAEHQFKIINLTRKNHLKFVVSIVRAKMLRAQNGSSNLIENEHEELGPTTIPLADFAKAKTRLRRKNRISQLIDRTKLPNLEVAYEDLLNDESGTLKKIWDFLEVKNIATTGRTRKSTPQDLRNAVVNLDEILAHNPEMVRYVDQV